MIYFINPVVASYVLRVSVKTARVKCNEIREHYHLKKKRPLPFHLFVEYHFLIKEDLLADLREHKIFRSYFK